MIRKQTPKLVGLLILLAYAVLASGFTDSKVIVLVCEAFSGIAVMAIAVLMLPFFKSFNKKLSLFYLLGKISEGMMMIIAGFLFVSETTNSLLIRDQIYSVHGYVFALSAFVFYYLLYKTKLIPNWLSIWGMIAVVLLTLANVLVAMGLPLWVMILSLPIMVNEVVLALWLMIKGFNK